MKKLRGWLSDNQVFFSTIGTGVLALCGIWIGIQANRMVSRQTVVMESAVRAKIVAESYIDGNDDFIAVSNEAYDVLSFLCRPIVFLQIRSTKQTFTDPGFSGTEEGGITHRPIVLVDYYESPTWDQTKGKGVLREYTANLVHIDSMREELQGAGVAIYIYRYLTFSYVDALNQRHKGYFDLRRNRRVLPKWSESALAQLQRWGNVAERWPMGALTTDRILKRYAEYENSIQSGQGRDAKWIQSGLQNEFMKWVGSPPSAGKVRIEVAPVY